MTAELSPPLARIWRRMCVNIAAEVGPTFTQGRFHLVVLPGYSPQLNPDEWVWKNLKHDRVGRTSAKNREEFIALVRAALRRLQRRPPLIRAFFREPDLTYITAA